MRLTVIYNPKAGSQGWPKGALDERLRAAGHEPYMVSSKTDWLPALDEPTDAVVAAGGDGTVHKLARALAGTDVPLAIVPLGTANNVARAFGWVPGSDPFARMPYWGEDERLLRLECARSGDESYPFLEVLGVGAFARLLVEGPGKKRVPLASLIRARRKLAEQVMEHDVLHATAVLDGREIEGRFVMLACLRIASFGPALWLAPEQRPEAADMTLVGVRNDQREAFTWWLATGEGDIAQFEIGRGRKLRLTAPAPLHVDDRLIGGDDSVTVTVDGGEERVRVMV